VGDVVVGVARLDPVGDGHRPVGAHRQDPHQLAEIWPVVLVVAEGHFRHHLAAPPPAAVGVVHAGEGNRGGVVVELGAVNPERSDHAEDHLGEQAGPVGVEEPAERAPDPVVVDGGDLVGLQAQQDGVVGGGPLAQGVDGLAVGDQVAHHHPQHRRRRQAQPGVVVRDETLQRAGQAHTGQEVVDHRHRSEQVGAQLVGVGGHVPSSLGVG
jgi:hypothetical protein